MPPSTNNFIKRLARLAPQLPQVRVGSNPQSQIADQAAGGMPGFGNGGPTTTTPWGGGSGTITPPTTPNLPMGPPSPRVAPTTPTAPVAAANAAPPMDLPPMSGQAMASQDRNWVQRAYDNFDPLTHWLYSESEKKDAGMAGTSSRTYNHIGEIYAESPPDDNTVSSNTAFQQDRLGKIARLYNLDNSQIADRISTAQSQIAAMQKDAGLSDADMNSEQGRSIISQVYTAIGTDIVKQQDQWVYRNEHDPVALERARQLAQAQAAGYTSEAEYKAANGGGTPGLNGGQIISAATNSPFAQYGIWTPDQQIAMQAMIGNYVQSQDQRYAASGGSLNPSISAAYMEQAQAIPAIRAFEGQAQLAAQNQQLQAQYDNLKMQYQFQQWMQGQTNTQASSGAGMDLNTMMQQAGLTPAGGAGS